jgi:hypothetical protein
MAHRNLDSELIMPVTTVVYSDLTMYVGSSSRFSGLKKPQHSLILSYLERCTRLPLLSDLPRAGPPILFLV